MRKKINLHIFLGGAVLLLAAAVLLFHPFKGGSKTVTVEITEDGFNPATLEINAGDSVRFVNKTAKPRWPASDPHPVHDFYPEFDPQHEIAPHESWTFTFTKSGDWTYHDHLSPHRRGEIIVKDGSASVKETAKELADLQSEKDPKAQAKIVRAMAEKYGPKQALELMKISGLPYTGETHLLVHEIGNVAYERYGDQALLYCDESFLSACFHGVVLNALGDRGMDGVVAMLRACKAADVHVLSQCSHAAGHGFLAYNDYKVFEALPYCDRLHEIDNAIPTFNCNDGVFMENIFGVHGGKPSPNRLVKADDPYYPCDITPDKYQPGCWANQATLMYQLFAGDLKKVAQACDKVQNAEYQKICYNNFARQIHPLTLGKSDKALALCQNATGKSWQDECLITLVNAAFSVGDKKELPYELCAALDASPKQNECYEVLLANIGSYAKGPADLAQMCGYIKDHGRIAQCEARYAVKARLSVAGTIVQKDDIEKIKQVAETAGVRVAYDLLKKDWAANPVPAHDLAHLIGNLAYGEQGAAGFAICDNNFAFGCYHGLFEVLVKKEGKAGIENSRRACNALSPEGQVASCLHGIGHGIMGLRGEIGKAVGDCEGFAQSERIYCFDGAYMEYFNGIMREGARPSASLENPWDFCLAVSVAGAREQCVRNQALFFLHANAGKVPQVTAACGELTDAVLRTHCAVSVGLYSAQTSNGKPAVVEQICGNFTAGDDKSLCVWGGAKEFVFQGWSMPEARGLCSGLAEPWQGRCLSDIDLVAARYGR